MTTPAVQLDIEPAFDQLILDRQSNWPFVSSVGTLKPRHYGVIYADPPWRWKAFSAKGMDRSAEQHYPTMSLADIKALPVAELAAKDCVLLMWMIDSMLPEALDVMKAWGFSYRTVGFTWAKVTKRSWLSWTPNYLMTLGYWTRSNPEQCWLGTRGKPKRNEHGKGVRQLVHAPIREHSRKPDEMHGYIQTLLPGPYCELFSRRQVPGWDVWGNDPTKFNEVT